MQTFIRRNGSRLQLILHHESTCDSKHVLVQVAVGWRDSDGKDWIGVAVTKRDRDIITDLVVA